MTPDTRPREAAHAAQRGGTFAHVSISLIDFAVRSVARSTPPNAEMSARGMNRSLRTSVHGWLLLALLPLALVAAPFLIVGNHVHGPINVAFDAVGAAILFWPAASI